MQGITIWQMSFLVPWRNAADEKLHPVDHRVTTDGVHVKRAAAPFFSVP